jgi:hypothetical protein
MMESSKTFATESLRLAREMLSDAELMLERDSLSLRRRPSVLRNVSRCQSGVARHADPERVSNSLRITRMGARYLHM